MREARKFHFPKFKTLFFWKSIRNFFRVGFFIQKVSGSPY